jgi:hypothetical protein
MTEGEEEGEGEGERKPTRNNEELDGRERKVTRSLRDPQLQRNLFSSSGTPSGQT